MSNDDLAFLNELERRIEFHRTNQNDAYNISVPVMVALQEVYEAFAFSRGMSRPEARKGQAFMSDNGSPP
jgi:hypothetical protein